MKIKSALSLILLVALSAQAAPGMDDFEGEELETAGLLSFTPSNSSIDDILKELGQNMETVSEARRSKRAVCTPAGPYGGGGGTGFNELPDTCNAVISRIFIRAARFVDAVQLTYRYSNGYEYTAGYYGGYGGDPHTITIHVSGGERVVGVFGRSAAYVDQLGFVTNLGRIIGPYGGCGGNPFKVNSCTIRGIHGRAASFIDSIGFFCG